MKHDIVRVRGAEMAVFRSDGDARTAAPLLVWAHGWGQDHMGLLPLAAALRRPAESLLLDFPGFGAAPEPPAAWSTADYADAAAEWLSPLRAGRRVVWVGYSFGCRVGLQLAARHPGLVDGLFLVASPGLKRQRSPLAQARFAARRLAFRVARAMTPEGPARERLRERFGSSDYRRASPVMRGVLVKSVGEDLSEAARAVRCPVLLLYGERDEDTPPDIGTRLRALIPQSRLVVLRSFGHLDVVTEGRHQVAQRLSEFLEQLA